MPISQITMAHLILLIGLPGSGKSFVARQLVAECPHRQLIATDTIRAQLFGDEAYQGPWGLIWQEVERQFRQVTSQRGHFLYGHGKTSIQAIPEAIYDATNAARRSRKAAIALAKDTGFSHITGLWIDMPLSLCLSRNRQRDRQVPEEIILQMHQQLTDAPPKLSEGFHRLIHWSANGLAEEGVEGRRSRAEVQGSRLQTTNKEYLPKESLPKESLPNK
jgi:predicted kinase